MNYFDLVSLHIISFILMLAGWVLYSTDRQRVSFTIIATIGTFMTGVSGVLLFFQFGMSATGPYPIWILGKSIVWLSIILLAVIFGLKFKEKARHLLWPVIILMSVAAALSIYKPL